MTPLSLFGPKRRPVDAGVHTKYLVKSLAVLEPFVFRAAGIAADLARRDGMARLASRAPEALLELLTETEKEASPLIAKGGDLEPPRHLRELHRCVVRALSVIAAAAKPQRTLLSPPPDLQAFFDHKYGADKALGRVDESMADLGRWLDKTIRSGRLTNRRVLLFGGRILLWLGRWDQEQFEQWVPTPSRDA